MTPPTNTKTYHAGPERREVVDVASMDAVVAEYARQRVPGTPGPGRERAVEAALPFAGRLARRYSGRGEPFEDLEQVARLALVRSVDRYDPGRGPFSAYATATIVGELRRHFRDTGWALHVPRRMQELSIEVGRAAATLTTELSRSPRVADLARHLGTTEKQVGAALQTASAYAPTSLNAPRRDTGVELGDLLGDVDKRLAAVDDGLTVAMLLRRLPPRERQLLTLRFYGNLTQAQIAVELGISQMHVSRLITRALAWLREAMLSDEPLRWRVGTVDPEPGRLVITVTPGDPTTVEVAGEIDRDTAGRLRERLLSTVRRGRTDVVVDLSGVPLVDASGIAALLAAWEVARGRGLRVLVQRAPKLVRRTLIVAGLLPLIDPPPPGTAR